MPVRLVAVKDALETLQMFGEALCQVSEVVQSAEAQNVLPGSLRQPTHCWVRQLLGGQPSRQQVTPLSLPQRDQFNSGNVKGQTPPLCLYEFPQEIKEGRETANSHVSHHINFVLIHHDASAQEKGKHEFVLLK